MLSHRNFGIGPNPAARCGDAKRKGKIDPCLLKVALGDLVSDLPGVALNRAIKASVNCSPFKK